jgi:hypothetical chaperone protein
VKPIAYGIDFGTTNSVLAVAYPNDIEVMPGFPTQLLRSAVYLHRRGTRTAGEDAIRQFLTRPDVDDARLLLELKATLSDELLDVVDVFGHQRRLEWLVAIVLSYLKLVADRATGQNVRRVVLGFPVAFPDTRGPKFADRQSLALERLCEAANQAGFDDVVPLEEPAAAASGEDAELYAALDFGGGTFDVAIVEGGEEPRVLALTGTAIGGEELTARLFRHKLTPVLGLDHPRMPARITLATTSLHRVLAALFDDDLPQDVLREFAPPFADILKGGFLYDLYQAVEEAKIRLSSQEQTTIELRRRGVELSVPVARAEFEAVIAHQLDETIAELDRALELAGVAANDLELVTLTGGSSRIPAFQQRVRDRLPTARLVTRDPYALVASGLAAQAQEVDW